ncbi:MAG: DNA gyrase C-terminal beta-propeller domain-containing protein, partial [Microcystaceae cyanobacterium]
RERIDTIIQEELVEIKNLHDSPRRTEIVLEDGEIIDTDLIANEKAIIILTEQGYIKRMPVDTFNAQNRATKGKAGAKIKEDDGVEHFMSCCDHDTVLFFSDRGVVYSLNAYQIPKGSRIARGTPIVQMLPIPKDEKITSIVSVTEFTEDDYLIMLTRKGYIKKTALSAFSNIRASGLIAISLNEGDQLRWVKLAKEEDSIIIGSRKGMAIHFKADSQQLRSLGRNTRGVKSMKFKLEDDEIMSMGILPSQIVANLQDSPEEDDDDLVENEIEETISEETNSGPWLLAITMGGYGKRVPVNQFRLQNRAGKGVKAIKFKNNTDQLAAIHIVNPEDELMIVTSRGIIMRQAVNAISLQSRNASGVRVQRLDEDDAIAAVALVPPEMEGDEEETAEVAEE